MKSIMRFCTLLCLALIMLFTGSGFTLSKMLCLTSGNTTYSISSQDDCCKDESAEATVKNKCCDVTNETIKVDSFKLSKGFELQPAQLFIIKLFKLAYKTSLSPIVINHIVNLHSPPLAGVRLLALISTFLI